MNSFVASSLSRLVPSLFVALLVSPAMAQDNILIYGNSIIDGPTPDYLSDLVVESGSPAPNIVGFIVGNGTTTTYVSNQGLISSSLPTGQTWDTMIVQGGTLETTNFMGNVVAFQANMLTLGGALFSHSPQAQFIGHETGADHPNSTRYPLWFPDAAAWLAFPQAAYAEAQEAITAAHPNSPKVKLARQGTCFANTSGYAIGLYRNDLHHLEEMGEALCACLYFIEIYGGRIEDLGVDYSVMTPLVTRLMADNINEDKWNRIVGFADRSQPRGSRAFPGSDSDFQLRLGVNTNSTDLRTYKSATAGDTLTLRLFSPLQSADPFLAAVYFQFLPTGVLPPLGTIPGLQLDRTQLAVYYAIPDLTVPNVTQTVPAGMAGMSLWLQGVSRAPTGTSFPLMLSDAHVVEIQ